jgi:hypothetical protein
MKIESSIFGTVEIGKNAPYVMRTISVNGRETNCGLYIADELESYPSQVVRLTEMLDAVDLFDRMAREILLKYLNEGNSTVIDFIDFHLEEVQAEIKEKLGVSSLDHTVFMHGLDLSTLGFHLDEDGKLELWCDYSIGKTFTDELLVVRFGSDEKFIEIAHES